MTGWLLCGYTIVVITIGAGLGYHWRQQDMNALRLRAETAELAYREVLRRLTEEAAQREARRRVVDGLAVDRKGGLG